MMDVELMSASYAEDIEAGIERARLRAAMKGKGPLATCRHVVGTMHTVSYDFHCVKDCPWFTSENRPWDEQRGWNQCDWRDVKHPGMCAHWTAQVAALKWLAEYTMRRAKELEADL